MQVTPLDPNQPFDPYAYGDPTQLYCRKRIALVVVAILALAATVTLATYPFVGPYRFSQAQGVGIGYGAVACAGLFITAIYYLYNQKNDHGTTFLESMLQQNAQRHYDYWIDRLAGQRSTYALFMRAYNCYKAFEFTAPLSRKEEEKMRLALGASFCFEYRFINPEETSTTTWYSPYDAREHIYHCFAAYDYARHRNLGLLRQQMVRQIIQLHPDCNSFQTLGQEYTQNSFQLGMFAPRFPEFTLPGIRLPRVDVLTAAVTMKQLELLRKLCQEPDMLRRYHNPIQRSDANLVLQYAFEAAIANQQIDAALLFIRVTGATTAKKMIGPGWDQLNERLRDQRQFLAFYFSSILPDELSKIVGGYLFGTPEEYYDASTKPPGEESVDEYGNFRIITHALAEDSAKNIQQELDETFFYEPDLKYAEELL